MILEASPVRTCRLGLFGAPNTGKSSLFNRLTGLRQRTANFPGITVDQKVGEFRLGEVRHELIDFPGSYSLAASSPEERVVTDALCRGAGDNGVDLAICVIDANQLKSSLLLPFQIADFNVPQVLVLNQWDLATRNALAIEPEALERRLGIPVVPVSSVTGYGIERLRNEIERSLAEPRLLKVPPWPDVVERAVNRLGAAAPGLDRGLLLRVLFDTRSAVLEQRIAEYPGLGQARCDARAILREGGYNPGPAEAVLRHSAIREVLDELYPAGTPIAPPGKESIDRILMHPVWGMVVFLGVMWVVFQSVYSWAGPVMDGIDAATGWIQGGIEPLLESVPLFQSLMVDGIIGGVGGVMVFLPQIFVLFFFIGLLEETGYMARAAFIMDRLMGWCGLNGKSFVPLLSSYACSVPGILAARTLEDPRARISTVMMAPFMSCSARLPVYVLLIGAFIEPRYGAIAAGWALFAAHFIGAGVAIPLAWFANRVLLRAKPLPFILEMPSYRVPQIRNLLTRMWVSGREFVVRAGTVILAFSIVIWALLTFPRSPEAAEQAQLSESYLGQLGRALQPVFDPAGFDWKITVGVLSSFPAREVYIATSGIIYNLGSDVDEESEGLREKLAADTWQSGPRAGTPVYTIPVVLALLVFFALCHQCAASVVAVGREIGWKWAAASFGGMSVLAWLGAVLVYQVGTALQGL